MKTGIFFTVRISSSRLPGKALLEVRGIPMIEYLISRFKATCSEKLIICTTDLPADSCFDALAVRLGVDVFHGDGGNILRRHLQCAEHFGLDFIINVDCDDIFSSPELVEKITKKVSEYDVIYTDGHPFGTNLFGYSADVLRKLQSDEKQVDTGWGALIKDNPAFSQYAIYAEPHEKFDIRLSMDYENDFLLFKHIIEALDMNEKFVSQSEILNYIKKNPEIANINKEC
jgi:spore coat polysaccharide biosynthesis protein SpsF